MNIVKNTKNFIDSCWSSLLTADWPVSISVTWRSDVPLPKSCPFSTTIHSSGKNNDFIKHVLFWLPFVFQQRYLVNLLQISFHYGYLAAAVEHSTVWWTIIPSITCCSCCECSQGAPSELKSRFQWDHATPKSCLDKTQIWHAFSDPRHMIEC